MQIRAILRASHNVIREGVDVLPEIMVPLVSHVSEMEQIRSRALTLIHEFHQDGGISPDFKIGAMIETPRAALTAGQIALEAEFLSFGTNDLTQMTLGFSRDDAEGKFLKAYGELGILDSNPFQSIDQEGVGRLVGLASRLGRESRPGLNLGVCGEHGGDPSSIEFFNRSGLDYVSCSPYRVPVARLAAAQAELRSPVRDRKRGEPVQRASDPIELAVAHGGYR
jgi:pyruvate,orthophosphate dikinase